MTKIFTVPAILTRCSSMVDGGVSLGFHTKELTSEEKVKIMEFHNQAGYLLFKENEIMDADIPVADAEIESKTPSQRLRGAMFVWWKQMGEKGDFEEFYRSKMNHIIEQVKGKLA
jgi:hypothetical protein